MDTINNKKDFVNTSNSNEKDINFITIFPYNETQIKYTINDYPEKRSKSIKKMYDYILSFYSEVHRDLFNTIYKLLYSFQSFIVDINNKTVIKLQFDKDVLFKNYMKTKREKEKDLKYILKQTKKQENKKDVWKNSDIYKDIWKA